MSERRLRAVPSTPSGSPLDDEDPSIPPGIELPARARRRRERAGPRGSPVETGARIALLLIASVLAAFLVAPRLVKGDLPTDPGLAGTPARAFVKADRDYALVDADATNALRDEATLRSRAVWDLDVAVAQRELQALHKGLVRLAVALEPVRAALAEGASGGGGLSAAGAHAGGAAAAGVPRAVVQAAEPVRAVFAGDLALLGLEAPRDDAWRALVRAIWLHPPVVDIVHEKLNEVGAQPVVLDRALLVRDAPRGIVVRVVPQMRGTEQVREDVAAILDVGGARTAASQKIHQALVDAVPSLSPLEAQSIAAFASSSVRASLTYNAAETDLRKRRDAERVPPVIVRARRGEVVLRPGEIITPRHHLLAQAMAVQQADDMRTRAALGTASFVGLLCVVMYLFGARRVFRRTLRTKDVAFLVMVLLFELVGIVAADAAAPLLPAGIPPATLYFAVPVALGAMTVRLTLTPDVALLFAIVGGLLGGVVIEPGMGWAVVAILASLTAAAGVSRSQRRSTLLLAGAGAGVVGAFAALTLELFRGSLVGRDLVWLMSATFAGGLLAGVLAVITTPLVELMFGYVTEQKLYRLADLNHPILKDLVVRAPGTWHHSVRTAELAEAAASAVGASPQYARVIALFHDIGKMAQPQLFLENQKGDNPHERLPPEASAEALRAHVTEGVKMALERGLPRPIAYAIGEHHADNLIEHFYRKAEAARADDAPVTDEKPFRYPGPLPQSRESALVMLADQIESASRSLEEPTPEKLCDLVDAFVQKALAEGLLDECDLSLKEIGRARDALSRVLLGFQAAQSAPAGAGAA